MQRLKNYLRRRLRKWLGINEISHTLGRAERVAKGTEQRLNKLCRGGVDVHFKGNTQILILSSVDGGKYQIYDFYADSASEIFERAAAIMGPAFPDGVIDAPGEFRRHVRNAYGIEWKR